MIKSIAKIAGFFAEKVQWSSNPSLVYRNHSNPKFEYDKFEPKQVLAGISFDADLGFVTIQGTDADDISIVSMLNDTHVRVALAGHGRMDLPLSSVNRIIFHGGDGNDFFRNDTWIPSDAFGGAGDDTLIGGWGDDRLYGEEGNNNLQGRAGDDLLVGGTGNDRLVGGAGNDTLLAGSGNNRLFGTSGNNILQGGDGHDHLWGGDGNDEIRGGAGDDFIHTGGGNNFADGGDGNDIIFGGNGDNFLVGGNGDDFIRGGSGNDRIEGIAGNNRLFGGAGDDVILGGTGDDLIRGGAGDDFIDGQGGNNVIYGDEGDDFIIGGPGNDIIFGGPGNDEIRGGDGDDIIHGGEGDDIIFGGSGNNLIFGGPGDDVIRGGDGDDIIYGGDGDDIIFGGSGNDRLVGGAGDDILFGQDGDDILIAGEGNNRLYGGGGNDILRGGPGNDGLFGGTIGNNRLTGGGGNNRFLISTFGNSEITDFTNADALIEFRNGSRNWSNVDIRVVDDALHEMHHRLGNTRLLKGTLTNEPIVFIKEIGVVSDRFGSNQLVTTNTPVFNPETGLTETITRVEHQIRFPDWDEFNTATNFMVAAEVGREIGFNWSSTEAMTAAHPSLAGQFPSFRVISDWRQPAPPQSLIPFYSRSLDNNWWYLSSARFPELHGRTNPAADFAGMMKFYFDPLRSQGDQIEHLQKFNFLDSFFERLNIFDV